MVSLVTVVSPFRTETLTPRVSFSLLSTKTTWQSVFVQGPSDPQGKSELQKSIEVNVRSQDMLWLVVSHMFCFPLYEWLVDEHEK